MRFLLVIAVACFGMWNIALELLWLNLFPPFFEGITTAYDKLILCFSFPAIDEQTTAVTLSTFGVLHVDFHFVFKLNIVLSQFSQKRVQMFKLNAFLLFFF